MKTGYIFVKICNYDTFSSMIQKISELSNSNFLAYDLFNATFKNVDAQTNYHFI